MRSELKVSLSNFTYNIFDKVPIGFYFDDYNKTPYTLDVEVSTFSDLGGYWYLDDCQGTVWTIKLPKEIIDLVKAEGSPYKRTKCGYWTVDYDNFELLANSELYNAVEAQADYDDWVDLTYNGPDIDDKYDGWNVSKIIRAKVRKWLDS